MDIVCPGCNARYRLDDGQIAPGRRVGCARCGQRWTPIERPITPAPTLASPPPPAPATPAPPVRERSSVTGWMLTVAVLALLALAAWHFRLRVEQLWPPSTRLYHLLGA